MFSLRFGANGHFNVRVSCYMFLFWFIVINDYFFYIVLPIAGRLLTDSFILHCYCSLAHTMVLHVVDCDFSVLPIAGRPATIK